MKTRLGYQAAGAGVHRRDIRRVHPRSTASLLATDLRNHGTAPKWKKRKTHKTAKLTSVMKLQ